MPAAKVLSGTHSFNWQPENVGPSPVFEPLNGVPFSAHNRAQSSIIRFQHLARLIRINIQPLHDDCGFQLAIGAIEQQPRSTFAWESAEQPINMRIARSASLAFVARR